MVFNSFEFLIFCPLVVIGFYLAPHRYRWLLLLISSYYFYISSEPTLIILLLISTLTDYFCARKMADSAYNKTRKFYLAISIFTNLGLLLAFKYLHFFISNLDNLITFFGADSILSMEKVGYSFNNILLPVGISFYTFQTMGYSIQVYRGEIRPERHFGKFALYVAFFPQLVAGPIERASRLLPQLKSNVNLDLNDVREGIFYIAWGLLLKIVVADRLGIYVDEAFRSPEDYPGPPLILAHWFFGFQVYYDFAAYTAIAIGASKTLGVDLIQNFNRPFFSTSAESFWKRWHISLMQWLRDFLYRPLVKGIKFSRLSAVLIVFFITGLWHGANWTFVVWGLLNGLLLVLEVATKNIRERVRIRLGISKKIKSYIGYCFIFSYIMFTLIFFRSPSLSHALIYIKNIFTINGLQIDILENPLELFLCFTFIFLVQIIHFFNGNSRVHEMVLSKRFPLRWAIYISYIFIIVLFGLNRQDTFIYFQF